MQKNPSSPSPRLLFGALTLLALALYLGWQWAGEQAGPPKVQEDSANAKATEAAAPVKSAGTPAATMPAVPKPRTDQLMTAEEGDQYIDGILRSNKPTAEMARDLQKLVAKFNGEAQVNASRHLVNLTADEDYGLIAGFLTDPKFNPDVIEVFFSDLMNRNRKLQMPLFMTILKNNAHPQNEQVRNVLTILAGEDFGSDWTKWDAWALKELQAQ